MYIYPIKLKSDLSTGMLPIAQANAAKYQLKRFLNKMPQGTIAYVAGGAPRDWHHGWGCRDVDIFYQVPNDVDSLNAAEIQLQNYRPVGAAYGPYGYSCGTQNLMSVHEYKIQQGSLRSLDVQLIRLEGHPLNVIKDFPINLSHIWMDTSGQIECDFWYQTGYNSRIISAVHDKQYYYPYLEKILPRFTDYAFTPKEWTGKRKENLIEEA